VLVVIAILTKKVRGRSRHEFPPSSVLRAERQVGLGECITFQNENWAASKSLADTTGTFARLPALLPKADVVPHDPDVRLVPKVAKRLEKSRPHSRRQLYFCHGSSRVHYLPQATVDHFGVASEYRE
jgi:hypothetical protein